MKAALLIVSWSLLLYSCKEVSFREPQPAGVTAVKEVPPKLRGYYRGVDESGEESDTLIIEPWGYHLRDGKDHDWLGKGVISDSLVIKFYQEYCFVNFRSGDQWVLRVIKQKPSGDIEFMSINVSDDKKRKDILKRLGKKFKVTEIERKDDTFYQINPTKEQLVQLINEGFFSKEQLVKVK